MPPLPPVLLQGHHDLDLDLRQTEQDRATPRVALQLTVALPKDFDNCKARAVHMEEGALFDVVGELQEGRSVAIDRSGD